MNSDEISALLQRFAPNIISSLGKRAMFGPASMMMQGDGMPDNSQKDMAGLTSAYAAARAQNSTPAGHVARGWDQFSPMSGTAAPMLPTPPQPAPVNMQPQPTPYPVAEDPMQAPPALSARAQASVPPAPPQSVPMPTPRPDDAPQAAPEMGFFQRNTAMMRDPSSGAFIDPGAADSAQASGPDVINKLLSYFHQKDA